MKPLGCRKAAMGLWAVWKMHGYRISLINPSLGSGVPPPLPIE